MTYNPDADPDDFDPQNDEGVSDYLSDPGNVRMWEAMGRDFAALPAAEQLPELQRMLTEALARRDEIAAVVAEGDLRRTLLAACADEVDRIEDRIVALSGPVPDHP